MDPLDRLERALSQLRGPGSFAAKHLESAQGLSLAVDGVGDLRFPLTEEDTAQLVDRAAPSPFGHRDQTLRDDEVRDSWEISGEHVHLDPRRWGPRLQRAQDALMHALGIPSEAKVQVSLHKLLVYEEGQFFVRHRDSEVEPDTTCTIVVVLPSTYEGGEVVVCHAGEQVTLATADDSRAYQLAFLGFYVDCPHEIRPVTSGRRVALTFRVDVGPKVLLPQRSGPTVPLLAEVHDLLEVWEPDWIVHLLQHQYSRQSLHWSRLKNGDLERVEALRRVAAELDCRCFLALAETSEVYDYGAEEDGEPPIDADAYIGDLQEREVELVHWIDEDGVPYKVPDWGVDPENVVTLEHPTWSPHAVEAFPWTGNEGGVAEKWFHLSAVVLVPRGDWRAEPLGKRPGERAPLRRRRR